MEGYKVKFKRIDTGKYWIAAEIKQGKYGLQAGMKKTPELMAYINSVADGGWLNFSIDKPYEPKSAAAKSVPNELNDEIPF